MTPIKIGKTLINPIALALTLALGTTGGLIGQALGLPLGLLLGSLLVVGAASILNLRLLGQPIHLPQPLRMSFIPIIGVAIGGAFTPAILQNALAWLPSLMALCLYVPLAHGLSYAIYRRGGISPKTAFYGGIPGGLMESVVMGEEAGADVALLVLMQFLRLIVTIVAVPLAFVFLTGHAVGSSAGVAMAGADNPLEIWDIAVLSVAAVGGYFLGQFLRMPAAIMTGPLLASALAHLTGLTDAVPPGWTIGMTQVVVGTGLGARFAGIAGAVLRRGAALAVIATFGSLVLALGFAEVLHGLMGLPIAGAFLAFAPGGITEMSLIALSLQISVVYVTLHHVVRIVLSVSIARFFGHLVKD